MKRTLLLVGLVGSGVVTLAGGSTAAQAATLRPASCAIQAHGSVGSAGPFGVQDRWTEVFTNNDCGVNVRAYAECVDVTGHRGYGKVLYGNGKSYYTCNAAQTLAYGGGQYYDGTKWAYLTG